MRVLHCGYFKIGINPLFTQCGFPDQFLQDGLGPVAAPHWQGLRLTLLPSEAECFVSDLGEIWGLQGRDGATSTEAPDQQG